MSQRAARRNRGRTRRAAATFFAREGAARGAIAAIRRRTTAPSLRAYFTLFTSPSPHIFIRVLFAVHLVLERLGRRAVVGHRGFPAAALENTLESFAKAVEAGADIVEMDVQVTADGVPVVVHDEDLRRVFGVGLNVRAASWGEVAAASGGRVPRLEDVLRLVDGRAGAFVEVKHPEDVGLVLDVIKGVGAAGWVAVISFHLEAVRAAAGVVPTGLVYAKPPGAVAEAKRAGCSIVLPRYNLATERAVAFAHRLGLYVVAWTVNDVETARELWRRGVDGVATDDVAAILPTKPL